MSRGRPLEGRRVVVTRGLEKGDALAGMLEDAGAVVLRIPLITPVALAADADLREAAQRLQTARAEGGAAWLVLTSETAAALVTDALAGAGLAGVRVAVVGPATAAALRDRGIEAELVAPGQEAESLATALVGAGVAGSRVLVVAARGGRNVVGPALARAGADVEVVEAYRTAMPEGAAEALRAAFAGGAIDAVTFTSGSTVRHFATAAAPMPHCLAACIGPVTARAAEQAGWGTIVVAREHSASGVATAVIEHLRGSHTLP